MSKDQRPPQIKDLFVTIRNCISNGKYRQSTHALDRERERGIDLPDVLYVLKNGYHEKEKTSYDEIHKTWKYAIRHKIEFNDIRVIITFSDDGMLIITVMHVAKP